MDDFELAGAMRELKEAVEDYDETVKLPVLDAIPMRSRRGRDRTSRPGLQALFGTREGILRTRRWCGGAAQN